MRLFICLYILTLMALMMSAPSKRKEVDMMQTSEKLRQLALALRDARLTIDPFDQEYAAKTIDAVARDLEAMAGQFDAVRTCQEVTKNER